jgi:hypothetical protein
MTIAFLFVLSARGQDEKKAERKEKITPAGEVAGRVAAVDAQKAITLEVRRGKGSQNVTWQTVDDVKIRTRTPPVVYDDKGKVRKHTAKELKELKGKGNLPGYTAAWDDLKVNEIVSVSLGVKKGEKNPVATMIVIEKMPK